MQSNVEHKKVNVLSIRHSSLVLVLMFSIPFLAAVLGRFGVYSAYVLVTLAGYRFWGKLPALLWIFLSALMFLSIIYMQDMKSLIDLISLVTATFYSYTVASVLMILPFEKAVKKLFKFSSYTILAAFSVSIILAGPLGLLNPLSEIMSGKRLLLLVSGGGHSVMNQLSAIALICLSLKVKFIRGQLLLRLCLSTLLIMAGSSTAFLVLITIWIVSSFERLGNSRSLMSSLRKSAFHLGVIGIITFVAANPVLTNNVMQEMRVAAGQNENAYRGDYTAGRALLNELLISAANEAPYIGSGDHHPVLDYGVRLITGDEKGAASESPLRLAVKFGWPFFVLNALLWSSSLFIGLTSKGIERKFFILCGYTLLIFTSTNAGFSVPQSATSMIFGPVLWFAILKKQQMSPEMRMFRISGQKEAPRRSLILQRNSS